jgi:tetratricopeptide (TPR) repeat protein
MIQMNHTGKSPFALIAKIFFAALAVLTLACAALAQSGEKGARVSEEPLTIPTYELGPANPYPPLLDWSRRKWRPVYPYPMLDTLTNKRADKTYKAVRLENEYVRVTVLPELGGHLYEIFDKTQNRDVLYTNPVIKYAMVAIRGAWVSGGIEWNFPDGHTLTTVSPIDYVMRMEADGSAAVTVGDTERVQGMQWAVTIRLRPGRKDVESEVTLNNRRLTTGRYWYWSTAGAPATEDMRFVYPMREAYPHAFWPVFSFPKEKGVDIGTYREVPNFLSLFARNSSRDFFGVYYERADWGVVHVADHREMPGKKTWTWGTDEGGRIWIDKLTDKEGQEHGGQYVEFQAGRFETQMEHQFIAPHRVEHFTEHWFGVNRLGGGWSEATSEAALRLSVEGNRANVAVSPNAKFDDAEITVEAAGARVASKKADLDPTKTFTASFDLPAGVAGKPVAVIVKSKDGRELIRYSTDTPPDGNPEFKPAMRPTPDPVAAGSAEQAYVAGLAHAKKSKEVELRAAFEEALRRDPGFAPAHTELGLSYLRTGEYEKAAEHLERALLRNKDAGDAHYFLALARRAQGREREAAEHLTWLVRTGYREQVAHYVLGEMALAAGRNAEALEHLGAAVMLDPRDLKARTLLALAERLERQYDAAQQNIDLVLRQMPIDYLALSEQRELSRARGSEGKERGARGELWRLLSREPDSVLTLAFDYTAAGRRVEAVGVLEEAVANADGGRVNPMIHYTLGYLYARGGDDARARAQYALGSKGNTAFVFPHRVEEIEVLRAAVETDAEDGRAAYYLGNVLASLLRGEEALAAWRDAVRLDSSNVVARRNLARALWVVAGRKEEAAAQYGQAVAAAPEDFHLYVEADQLLASMNATDRRVKLLESAPAAARERSPFIQSLAAAYVDAGRYEDASSLLERNTFTSGEGEEAALGIYRRAHFGLARKAQQAGDHARAAAEFLKATEYPKNFGVGRPEMQSQAREYVFAARELEKASKREESEALWRRAADEALNAPTQPEEPWSEHYYYKALALEHTGRAAEARALYERLARLDDERRMLEAEPWPATGAIRFALAGAGLKALGRTTEARAAFERALKLDPQSELARTQLSELNAPRRGASRAGGR